MRVYFISILIIFGNLAFSQSGLESYKDRLSYLQENYIDLVIPDALKSLDSFYLLAQKETFPDSLWAEFYYTKAKFARLQDEYNLSLTLLDSALQKIDINKDLDLNNRITLDIGTTYLVQGSWEKSKAFFSKLTNKKEIDPKVQEKAHTYLASLYVKSSQFDSCHFHLGHFYTLFSDRKPHDDSTSFAYTRFMEGQILRVQDSLENSRAVLLHSLNVFNRQAPKISHLISYPLEELGNLSMNLVKTDEAITFYEKAIEYIEQRKNPKSNNLYSIYNNLASCYGRKGEIERSNIFKIKAKNLALEKHGPDYSELAAINQGIALNYRKLGKPHEALEYLSEAKRIHSLKSKTNPRLLFVYNTESLIQRDLENYDAAFLGYENMEDIVLKNFGPEHSFMASVHNGRGQIYRQMENFEKALPNYKKALAVNEKVRGKSHPGNMNYHNNISASYLGMNNYEMAINSLHKSLAISLALNKSGLRGSPIDSRDALFGMGQVFYDWYMHDSSIQKLDSSKYYFDEGIKIMDDIRENRDGSLLSSLTTEEAFDYLSIFNEVCNVLDKNNGGDLLSASYKTLEKYRSMDLRSSYLEKYNDSSHSSPFKDIEKQLIKIRSQSLKLKSKRQNILDSKSDSNKNQEIEDSIFIYQQIKDSLLLELKEADPKNYSIRYDLGVKSVQEIQQNLLKFDEAIIQFQWHKSNIYTFVITQNTFDITKVPSSEILSSEIKTFKSAITNRANKILEHQILIGDLLFEKSLALLPSEIDHLILIPDGQIHLLPLEILRPSILANEMLIERYRISHSISSSMLFHQTHASKKEGKLLSVAPSYPDNPGNGVSPITNELLRSGELHLPFASKEAKAISDEVNGHVLLGSKASKENFLKNSSDYSVLHLAMHSILLDKDPQASHLLFPPLDSNQNSLYIHEISTYQMDKEMVILSACNTALGKIQNGDGIKGISYAFYQSGTRSTVTSLWKVPDQATQKIMVQFYRHLKNGMSKSLSLKQAKMDYISSAGTELEKHPFYWAGFILTGSDSSIEFVNSGQNTVIKGVILLILLIGLLGIFYNRRKRKYI